LNKKKSNKQQKRRIAQSREVAKKKGLILNDLESSTVGLEAEEAGLVITNFGLHVLVEGLDGAHSGKHYRCYKRADVPSLVAGDLVIWRNANPFGVVVARKNRSSKLARVDISGKRKSVAANVSQIFVVIACAPLPKTNLIDRYIVAAEAEKIVVRLVANKMDLTDHKNLRYLEKVIGKYQHVGYPVIRSSVKIPFGINAIKDHLRNETSLFVGQSGVGKSSLLNLIEPTANSPTRTLSIANEQGSHTTTASRLFRVSSGGNLIDSPGTHTFSLAHLDSRQLMLGFKDFHPFLGKCKFRDCIHDEQSGCALVEATKKNLVSATRLKNYHHIRDELKIT
jgi:ribosome biogenesis GTPase